MTMTEREREREQEILMGQRIGGGTDHVTHCLAKSVCVYWLDNYNRQNSLQSLLNSLLRLSPNIRTATGHDKFYILYF